MWLFALLVKEHDIVTILTQKVAKFLQKIAYMLQSGRLQL
jgi:hypothetical protein